MTRYNAHYAADDVDYDEEPRPFHRCTAATADHCRICSYLPDPGEDGTCPKCLGTATTDDDERDRCTHCGGSGGISELDDEADGCAHDWVTSDPDEGGDGRCYCLNCGADGDA